MSTDPRIVSIFSILEKNDLNINNEIIDRIYKNLNEVSTGIKSAEEGGNKILKILAQITSNISGTEYTKSRFSKLCPLITDIVMNPPEFPEDSDIFRPSQMFKKDIKEDSQEYDCIENAIDTNSEHKEHIDIGDSEYVSQEKLETQTDSYEDNDDHLQLQPDQVIVPDFGDDNDESKELLEDIYAACQMCNNNPLIMKDADMSKMTALEHDLDEDDLEDEDLEDEDLEVDLGEDEDDEDDEEFYPCVQVLIDGPCGVNTLWKTYDDSENILSAYNAFQDGDLVYPILVEMNNNKYSICFDRMTQMNLSTGFVRKIRVLESEDDKDEDNQQQKKDERDYSESFVEFMNEHDQWTMCGNSKELVEAYYTNVALPVMVQSNGNTYSVCFERMTQMNVHTGVVRKIRVWDSDFCDYIQ